MHASIPTILLATFAALTTAAPTSTNPLKRAGGPIGKPIPDTCTVTEPIPQTGTQGYVPKPELLTPDWLLYASYYPSPSQNKTEMSQFCLEQCYGFGDNTECKGMFWAEQLLIPEGYRGAGTYNTGCLFFKKKVCKSDFVEAPAGKGTSPFAADIEC